MLRWTSAKHLIGLLIAIDVASLANAAEPRLRTFAYKRAGDLEIKADVYAYDDDEVRPAVVWIHGGALINGHRKAVSGKVREMATQNGRVCLAVLERTELVSHRSEQRRCMRRVGRRVSHTDNRFSRRPASSRAGCLLGIR